MNALTFRLWDALRRPPIHHPLFRRAAQNRYRPELPPRPLSQAQRYALIAASGLATYIGVAYFTQLLILLIFFIPLGVVLIYMLLHGTLAGLYWATRISGAIARERERGTYELLSTSPYGAFSASWAICTGSQYYDQTFNGAGVQRVWFARIFFLTLLLLSAVISLADPRGRGSLDGFLFIVEVVALLALAFRIDDVQSTVIGSLVGVIVPLFARNRLDARVGAFAAFLLLQASAYLLVWWLAFVVVPQVNANAQIESFMALPAEQLLVFFVVREGIARVLWGLNLLLFAGDVSDVRLLSKGGRLIC